MPVVPRQANQGFALVEALAALVVVGLISVLLVAGLATGRRVWQLTDSRDADGEAVEGAQMVLRERLEAIFPATKLDQSPPYVDLQGGASDLNFLGAAPRSVQPAPLQRYQLALSTGGELVLSSMSDVDTGQPPMIRQQVLMKDVREIEIAYFGASVADPVRRWRWRWQAEPGLPELIRVRLTFVPGDEKRWPDLLVHPRATIDSDCLLNRQTGRCKGRA